MKGLLTHFFRICFQATLPEDEFVLLDGKDFMSFKLSKEVFGETKLSDMFPNMTRGVLDALQNWRVAALVAKNINNRLKDGMGNNLYC